MGRKLTTSEFITKVEITHSYYYTYPNTIYNGNKNLIFIQCPIHGEFKQTARSHMSGSGCPKCFGTPKLTHEEFIKKVNLIHDNFYSYPEEYNGNKNRISIICPIHGEFKQTPSKHYKHGCKQCGFEKISKSKNVLNTKRIIKNAKEVHGNLYDYSLTVYTKSTEKIKIICYEHGVFEQIPKMHINRKQGCPRCNNSHGEKMIEKLLINKHINFETQKTFDECKNIHKLPFDFYLEKYNLCIEFDGEQHFKAIKYWGGEEKFKLQQKRDSIKNIYCVENNINLLRIRFDENINEKITNYFSEKNIQI